MELTGRDLLVLELVHKFNFCLGRHINILAGFTGMRATDRRLKLLVEKKYLSRRKYLYGVPYLYTLTHKGRMLLGVNKRDVKVRVERITHDIYVLDTLIFFIKKLGISLENIESEKELHIKDGFGARKHHPDFIAEINNERYAVEVELNLKTKNRLEANVRGNYLNFDYQVWVINDNKVLSAIRKLQNEYPNIKIIRLEEVLQHVRA